MKWYLKIAVTAILATTLVTACKKVQELPFYDNGNAPVLTSSAATIAAMAADSNKTVVTFSWSNPKYANDSATSKYILEIDSSGRNFAKAVSKTVNGALNVSYTGREMNAILLNYGFAVGAPYALDIRVTSSYGNNNERYISAPIKITVTSYRDSSVLKTSSTSVVCDLNTADLLSNTFTWTPSFIGYANAVTYTLQYDSAGKNFVAPIEIPVGASILTKGLTQGEMNATALGSNIPGGNTGKVQYRVKAVTAQGAIVFSNTVFVTIKSYIPLLRFYLPGSYQGSTGNGTDWTPADAPEFIRDLRPGLLNNMYYMYIFLPAKTEFKVTQGRSWNTNFGGTAGNLVLNGGANLSVAAAGVYRISINRSTLKYNITTGRMGFVGGATQADWNPPAVFPNGAMSFIGNNRFIGLANFTVNGWKIIDNNAWNNGSNAVDETRSYGSTGPAGSSLVINGDNMPNITTAGVYRVIWNGSDVNNIKYDMNSGAEMRIVGDGIQGVAEWTPGVSPTMTYLGLGKWRIIRKMIPGKDFKFVAGNAWGAFDYEDAGSGKIKWDGGGNMKVPGGFNSALDCTIILDEYTQTWTITQ